jgi:hypothetical protein
MSTMCFHFVVNNDLFLIDGRKDARKQKRTLSDDVDSKLRHRLERLPELEL